MGIESGLKILLQEKGWLTVFAAIFGSILGSFLNVCIWRIPRKESIVFPASHCPKCNKNIAWYDNIPIFSYIVLGGKCRFCKNDISLRYPLVESLMAALTALLFWQFGLSLEMVVYLILMASLVVQSFIDLDHFIIPDVITIPGMILGLILSIIVNVWGFGEQWLVKTVMEAGLGWVVGFGGLYITGVVCTWIFKKEAMGFGDVKLMGMVGLFMGIKGVLFTLMVGSLVGSIIGLMLMKFKGLGRKAHIPFGPFLGFGAILYLLSGEIIINWYTKLLFVH